MRTLKNLVLDASALIQGYSPGTVEQAFTVPAVLDEIRGELARIRVEALVAGGRIILRTPDEASKARLEEEAAAMGESMALSATDKQVLSLALQLASEGHAPVIVSDDYSVQNMADHLRLRYMGLAVGGIKKQFRWVTYCPGCRRSFEGPQTENTCPICGTPLKKRPVDGRRARRNE
ncbi:DNA-binding protein [Candidatus Bathyarchaeota archaeon]|nr:DNA-binding protein [Candidatus Bathyarchaeota archaeon]